MPVNADRSNSESRIKLSERQHSRRVIRLGQLSCGDGAACREAHAQRRQEKLLKLVSNVPAGHNLYEVFFENRRFSFSGITSITTKTKMSNTLTKSLILNHPKSGQTAESTVAVLAQTTSHNEDGSVVVSVEIPGVDPSTVEVSCESNILKITCPKGEATLSVAPGTEVSEIKAEILWGLLTLVVPPAAAPSVQTIKVNLLDTVKKAPVKSPGNKIETTPEG